MDLTSRIQEKLNQPERCLTCLSCRRQDWERTDCVLAVVERQKDHASTPEKKYFYTWCQRKTTVFVFKKSLQFDKVFPICNKLTLKLDMTQGFTAGSGVLQLCTSEITESFEVSCDESTEMFSMQVQTAQSLIPQSGLPSSFSWLDKYRNQQSKDLLSNPFAEDQFDPMKHMNQTEQPNAVETSGDWPFSHIVRPERPGTYPIVYDDTISIPVADQLKGFDDNFVDKKLRSGSNFFTDSSSFNSKSSANDDFITSSLEKEISQSLPGLTVSHFGVGAKNAVGNRDLHVRLVMKTKESEFTDLQHLRIFCGTWNVNGQPATESLNPWLRSFSHNNPPDIFALGFQELDLSNQAFIFSDSPREEEWYKAVKRGLPSNFKYKKLRLVRLVGMMLIVFAKEECLKHISEVSSEVVGTGLMGTMGNKGGVAVRFRVHETSLCFVNSHLAAHTDEYERRNQDFREINNRMLFNKNDRTQNPLTISGHDVVFWIGDLNYRVTELNNDKVKAAIDNGMFEKVLEYDQLNQQKKAQRVFADFEEAPITFQPTYKYDVGTDNWDSSEKCRCPAWCDRILWRGEHVRNMEYRSHMIHRQSDHKPVSAAFEIDVKVINNERHKRVYEEVMRTLDRLENEFLPQVTLDAMELDFGDVMFIEPIQRTITLTNTGQVPAEFVFINKLDEDCYCRPWLDIKPFKTCVLPGKDCQIEFEVYVNEQTVAKLNANDDQIDDILVLHLEGGKDFFITVTGKFIPSCFGSSIDALVHMHQPIRDVAVADLINLEHINAETSVVGKEDSPLLIPKELWRMVDHLNTHGKTHEFLFQQPGLHKETRAIRDSLDTGTPDVLPGGIHSVAEALLLFLDALPEPVIPFILYERCLDCCNNLAMCKQMVLKLPLYHRRVFIYLVSFLRELLKHSLSNGLEVDILASMFGRVMLRPPPSKSNTTFAGVSRQMIDRKKTAFIQHFVLNDVLDLLPEPESGNVKH